MSDNIIVFCRDRNAPSNHTVGKNDDTRGCGDTICPPEDEQRTARNMLRIVV